MRSDPSTAPGRPRPRLPTGALACVVMLAGCLEPEDVYGEVEVIGQRSETLHDGPPESVNGLYGAGCTNYSGAWSVEILPNAVLDHDELAVIRNNTDCVLTLTGLRTGAGPLTAVPAIVLGTTYSGMASSFGEFSANAMVDSLSFAADIELTILHTDHVVTADQNVQACRSEGQAVVELGAIDSLGAAGSYVLLAKTGITNVTGSSISGGHVGVSPAAASALTGFGLTLDPSGVYSTSSSVVAPARIYAADYAAPTPADLTTAVLAMQAAYTDAAGRTPTDYDNLGSGVIGGLTLGPGLYTWDTAVDITADLTLAGCPSDVWIFQITDELNVDAGKRVLLSSGAQASNVFWQVASTVTVSPGGHLEGIVLSQAGITLQTGASLHGRALAQSLIALDDNVVTAP